MRTYRWRLTGGLALLAAAACTPAKERVATTSDSGTTVSGVGGGAGGNAHVRVINAVRAGKSIDVKSGDQVLFPNVPSETVTPFTDVPVSLSKFTAQTSGSTVGGAEGANRELMVPGEFYTIVVIAGENGPEPTLRVLHEDLSPGQGQSRVRVIHAAPGIGEIDVGVRGSKDPLFQGVNYASEAGFKDVDPMTATLDFRRQHATARILSLPGLKLETGTAETVVLTGSPTDKLKAFTFRDSLRTAPRTP